MKLLLILCIVFISCSQGNSERSLSDNAGLADSNDTAESLQDTIAQQAKYSGEEKKIHTGNTTPGELLAYAQSLMGTPYKYGSTDPNVGFDCSGFITHVFNHFGINVPRSSIDFTNIKHEVKIEEAKPGDIVLFTGTDSTIRDVGHMGIVTANDQNIVSFIHSSSGKAMGVTVTPMNKYHMGRFVKVLRIFPQNE